MPETPVPEEYFSESYSYIDYKKITSIMHLLNNYGQTFHATGGTHISGLFRVQKFVCVFEDISRHNSIMKTLGCGLRKQLDLSHSVLFVSCRITAGIIEMLADSPLNIICSQSAVTDLAVEKARFHGKSIIGFIRGERMNVYTNNYLFI